MQLTQKQSTTKVLVYRLGSLGDTVIALPLFHLIARAFPNAERRMITSFPPNAKAAASSAVLADTGLIHAYYRYTYGTRSIRELAGLWWNIVRWRPQVMVYMGGPRGLTAAKRDAWFFRLCGIRNQVGVPLSDDKQHYRVRTDFGSTLPYGEGLPLENECSRLARNLEELGDAYLDRPESWDLHLTEQEKTKAAQVLLPLAGRPFITVSIGTKVQANDWERDNWTALLADLPRLYPDYAIVLCGAREEFDASELVSSGARAATTVPVLNLCGMLSPRESAAVFSRSLIFIGHDSGPLHLAAAVQTPCVAVFSSRNFPGVWFPYGKLHRVVYHTVNCQNCRLTTCLTEQKKCILSITVQEVLKEILLQLPSCSLPINSK